MDYHIESRKSRGKTQKLFLVQIQKPKIKYERSFDIMGTTGNVYTVDIKKTPTCTCPDHKTRNRRCKHIYFVLIRVMLIAKYKEDQEEFTEDELESMIDEIPAIGNNVKVSDAYKKKYEKFSKKGDIKTTVDKRLDDICPICLDDLDNEPTDYCKYSCGKAVHKECFEMWLKKQKTKSCIFCRANWTKNSADEKYINLNL
jgi:hypothetical protein